MRWIEIDQSNILKQEVQSIMIDGKKLCLIYFNEIYYITNSKCPHAGADISEGWCNKEGFLICPFHRHEYNLENGRGAFGQGDYLKTYPVKKENGKLLVGIEKKWWRRLFT